MDNKDGSVFSALIQALSALSIFVFYFGWVWQDAYLQMFGLNASSLDQPFYYFFIQGLKINFPFQSENQSYTQWHLWAWVINFVLVISALVGSTAKWFNNRPLTSLLLTTPLLVGLLLGMQYVGSRAGYDRAKAVLESPRRLRAVTYEFKADDPLKVKRFSGYLLMLTKDRLYVVQPRSLQEMEIPRVGRVPPTVTIVPIENLSYLRTVGYEPK